MSKRNTTLSLLCILIVLFTGCEPAVQNANSEGEHSHTHGDHSHSHGDHSHAPAAENSHSNSDHVHGINGGHIFKFEPDNLTGEWLQSRNSDLIRIFILDENAKSNHPVVADSLIVRRGESIFSLDPENTGEEQASAMFSLEDQELAIAMNLGVTVELQVGETAYVGTIEPLKAHRH